MNTRQLILDNLSPRLATVAPATGWGAAPIALGALPCIAWRDTVLLDEERVFGLASSYRLRMAIGHYSNSAAAVRTLTDQTLDVLYQDLTAGGYALRIIERGVSLKVSTLGDTVACAVMTIDIRYRSLMRETGPADTTITADGEVLTADGETLTW